MEHFGFGGVLTPRSLTRSMGCHGEQRILLRVILAAATPWHIHTVLQHILMQQLLKILQPSVMITAQRECVESCYLCALIPLPARHCIHPQLQPAVVAFRQQGRAHTATR